MAILKPDNTYIINGVTVSEKIIPDGTYWQDAAKAKKAGFSANSLYKKQQKLSNGTGLVQFITIHNTNDISGVNDDAEQYTRATYNENMGSARVHFYVDDVCAWQNLKAGTGMSENDPLNCAEVGWHAGDGSQKDGGNMTSLGIEIIMNDNLEHDRKALDNGARIAAWLLKRNDLTAEKLVTHTYWVNKLAGKNFDDVDRQSTNQIKGKKWCPAYIFNSNNQNIALANWKSFKELVSKYMWESEMDKGVSSAKSDNDKIFCVGDLIHISYDAVYYDGTEIPEWVKKQKWYIKKISGDRAVIDKDENGKYSINSPINVKFLNIGYSLMNEDDISFEPYTVKVTVNSLNIRSFAGTNYKIVGAINDRGVYTIVSERQGKGASKWGELKSGAGWISLDYVKKVK